MLWLQTLPAFALWLLFVAVRRKWMQQTRQRYALLSRRVRIVRMLASVVLSVAILFGGVFGAANLGWLDENGLSLLGFLAITISGLAFLHFQMVATALMLSLALDRETRGASTASNPQKSPGDTP